MGMLRSVSRTLCLGGSVIACAQVHATPRFDYRLDMGIEHNDNVNLSENDPVSEDILRPAFGFRFSEAGSTIQAYADGVIEYRDYLSGVYANEWRSQLSGRVNWVVMPERLSFVFEDSLGVQPINTLVADAPSNLQQTNVFALGPTFNFHLGAAARGQAELRYINSYAEDTDAFDSSRFVGALRVIKDLDPTSQLSGNLQAEHIDFTHSTSGPSYDRYSLYGRYTRTLRLFDYSVDLGYTRIDSGGAGGSDSKPLVRFNADWRPSERSTLTLNAAHQYTDAASSMITTVELRVVPVAGAPIPTSIATGGAVVNSDPYLEDRISLAYTWQGATSAFGVAPFYHKLAYLNPELHPDNNDLNESGRGANVFASWDPRPGWKIGAFANGEDLRYRGLDRSDRSFSYGAFLIQQWARHWSWRLDLTHNTRNSNVAGQSSDQNIVYVSVSYTR